MIFLIRAHISILNNLIAFIISMQGEIRVIGASYLVENNEPVIEIFGRDINGDSYTLLYKGFKPYFL